MINITSLFEAFFFNRYNVWVQGIRIQDFILFVYLYLNLKPRSLAVPEGAQIFITDQPQFI